MNYSKILGTGSYLPPKILTNFDLEEMVDTTNEWIIKRTGIKQRHIASEDETTLSMAAAAGRAALTAAKLLPADIDMIIVTSTTPDMVFPSTASLLQAEYGISGCPAFDLNGTACAAFMYAFSIADQYIKTGAINHALIIGSEVMSRILNWGDRNTCVLFGDGAGAMVLGKSKEPGVISTHIHSDGSYKDLLYLRTARSIAQEQIQMAGNQLFKIAVNLLDQLFDETLAANSIDKSEIDWLVPHQANIRIIQAMAKKLDLPMERVSIALDEQANTSSASIPLALDKAIRAGKIVPGQLIMMEGFGGGLAWGSALVRY